MKPALPILAAAVSLAAFASQSAAQNPKPVFASKVVTAQTPGHVVEVSADLSGAKKLFLAVDDGGNGFACDWADWVEPRLIVKGKEVKLTDLKWKSASADWGNVAVGKNAGGGELRVNGQPVAYGIGVHAISVIEYDLPEGRPNSWRKAGWTMAAPTSRAGRRPACASSSSPRSRRSPPRAAEAAAVAAATTRKTRSPV
ncbi:MAG: NPCBM/NEW2 domain-containing protein [Verrucomicrobiales bacterium]